MKKIPFILALVFFVLLFVQLQAQSIPASRLIGFGMSEYITDTFRVIDTIFYNYTGSRGYDALNNMWKYDNATLQSSVVSTDTNYDTQSFDLSNNDTTFIDQKLAGGIWINNLKKLYHYTPSKYIDTETDQTWNTSTSTWVNSTKTAYIYNTSNDFIQKTSLVWSTASGTWDNNNVKFYNYDISGDLILVNRLIWNYATSAFDSFVKSVYVYDGSHDILTQTNQTWNFTTGTWNNSNIFINSGFVATQPLLNTILLWNNGTSTYDSSERWHYTYNTYNQILTQISEIYVSGAWQYQYNERYYYELYTSGVNNISAKGGDANIYPVPTNNALNIDINWNEPQPFTIAILDMQGRIINQWQADATIKYHKTISVNNIPAGDYLIKITGTKGEVLKQIVVTHGK